MRRFLAVFVAALALPAAAQAKEINALAVCGASECRDAEVAGWGHDDPIGGSVAEGPSISPFLRLDFTVDGQEAAFSVFYEPASGLVATQDQYGKLQWARLAPPLAEAVKDAAARLEPFPAPRVTAVRVGARRMSGDPASYLALLSVEGPSVAPKTASSGLAVVLEADRPNPWTERRLLYYPADDVLQRDGTFVELPRSLADRLEGRSTSPMPWLPIGVAVLGAALLVSLFLRMRSVRRRALVVAGLLVLVLPATASAKGPLSAQLCGPEACQDVGRLELGPGGLFDTSRPRGAPPPAPYYELRLDFGGGNRSSGIFYEPRSGLVSYADDFGSGAWAPLAVPLEGVDVTPFPAPRLTGAWVGNRRVAGDASGYLRLFALDGPYAVPESPGALEWIRLEASAPSPWTTHALVYYPRDDLLLVPGARYVRVPAEVAAAIEAAKPLPTGGSIVPWIALGTLLAGTAALLLLRTLGSWSESSRQSSSSTSSGRLRLRPGRIRRSSAGA